ncbi:MAG TPA: HAD hydrolase-like protein, partial [Candidatus Lokiarchaeia archaeon]|nr:HAD hydrolase-like protein [Candidatus Lokiarchaeia archaeon]
MNPEVSSPRTIQAVLFDFDGVLWGCQGSLFAAKQMLHSPGYDWSKNAASVTPLEIVRRFEDSDVGDNIKTFRRMYRNFADLLPARYHRIRFMRKMGTLYPKYDLQFGELIPGVMDIIKELHSYGVPMAIVSNSMKKRVETLTGKTGIRQYLTVLIGREDLKGYKIKPSPYPILLSLLKIKGAIKIYRDNVYFIGDLPTDIQSAHNAKVRSIGVTTG